MPKPPGFEAAAITAAAHALASGEPLERAAAARLSRMICGELAARHPGRSIELRVPPFAAVQLGMDEAGAHRRGTPPNVIELDAATLVRLAAGSLAWEDARAGHLVRASGIRSDLAAFFPLTASARADVPALPRGPDSGPTGSPQDSGTR